MRNFKVHAFLDAANELVRADEVERAIHLLDNLPGFYRDNPPPEVAELKHKIVSRIATASFYAWVDANTTTHDGKNSPMIDTLRGRMIIEDVKNFNKHDQSPVIVDFGPGDFWVNEVLSSLDLSFRYEPITLASRGVWPDRLNRWPDPVIFCAFEIIEHLWNEQDIRTEATKLGITPDIVHVSTPLYTFDTECEDWTVRQQLGHLRTYTPMEFNQILSRLFPEYTHMFYNSQIMHSRMTLKNTKFAAVKETEGKDILDGKM